ncbi:unnamed protein product [Effrenium voratum]|nr:unnamed protein product [Effrenium voratum]
MAAMTSKTSAGAPSLDDLMKRRREVCTEFESQPLATTADATCAVQSGYSNGHKIIDGRRQPTSDTELQSLLSERRDRCEVLESSPQPGVADALWNKAAPNLEDCPREFSEFGARVKGFDRRQELDLKPKESSDKASTVAQEAWADLQAQTAPGEVMASKARQASQHLQQLFAEHGACAGVPAPSQCRMLAAAFVEKHMRYLSFETDHLLAVIKMLMRYHYPEQLADLQRRADARDVLEAADAAMPSLDNVSCTLGPLRFLLGQGVEQNESGPNVCLLCSLVVQQQGEVSEVGMLFVLLAALSGFQWDAWDPVRLWEKAQELLAATPRSVVATLGDERDRALRTPICAVAPDEVLQHVFERPAVEWKLLVVDLRPEETAGLPVCLRVKGESLPELLPRDDAIHLCIVDAAPPDRILEVCFDLVKGGIPHVSVVDGGWRALEQLVTALGLELMPGCAPAELSIRETFAGVAEQVASLGVSAWTSWASGTSGTSTRHEVDMGELLDI